MKLAKNVLEKSFNYRCWPDSLKSKLYKVIIQGVMLLNFMSRNMTADQMNFSRWMENLPPRLHNIPLTDLAIPGSHDSCSYSLNPQSSYSIGLDPKVKEIISSMDTATGKELVYRWSVTQAQTIREQLQSGIRYLDIRISYNDSQGEIYVSHGLLGTKLDDILMQVKDFLKRFTKEVILLDFNHIYNPPRDRPTVLSILFSKMKHYLGSQLCPRTELNRITLQYLWRIKKQVLFFFDRSKREQLPKFAWSSETNILAPFDIQTFKDPDKWIEFLTVQYRSKRPQNMFYITQGVLLPHWIEVLAGQTVNATLKAWISQTASTRLVEWMKTRKRGPNGINIVIADYIEEDDFVPTVLHLNGSGRTALHMRVYVILLVLYVLVCIR